MKLNRKTSNKCTSCRPSMSSYIYKVFLIRNGIYCKNIDITLRDLVVWVWIGLGWMSPFTLRITSPFDWMTYYCPERNEIAELWHQSFKWIYIRFFIVNFKLLVRIFIKQLGQKKLGSFFLDNSPRRVEDLQLKFNPEKTLTCDSTACNV